MKILDARLTPVAFAFAFAVDVTARPGLGVRLDRDELGRAHEQYTRCGQTSRDDVTYMRRYVPDFTPNTGRW